MYPGHYCHPPQLSTGLHSNVSTTSGVSFLKTTAAVSRETEGQGNRNTVEFHQSLGTYKVLVENMEVTDRLEVLDTNRAIILQ